MKIIRYGVFETNSSSTHSLTLGKDKTLLDTLALPTNDNNEVIIKLGEFGWGPEEFRAQLSKLAYLLTMVAMTELVKEKIPDHISPLEYFRNTEGFKALEEFVQKFGYKGISTELINIEWKSHSSGGRYLDISGYIDHQSCESYNSLAAFLEDEGCTIETLILGKTAVVKVDNDNH